MLLFLLWPAANAQVVMNQFMTTFDQCPNVPVTCTNSTPVENTCCFESPGGIMLQTQFWDYYPAIGAADEFTLHGLWPDNCDGSYEQFCKGSLNINKGDIEQVLVQEFQDERLFRQMQRCWKNFNGDDEQLWIHEYNKHATCIKTLWPECYGAQFRRHENIYDFFNIAVKLHDRYPTFKFLAAAGIEPSATNTYTRAQIDAALSAGFGHRVFFKCNRFNALQEVWYYHYLQGPLKNEQFVAIDTMLGTNCPADGIKFLPKGEVPPAPPAPPKNPANPRGHVTLSGQPGCLISNGQWYSHGTCASFRAEESQFGGVNLVSSKGVCGINSFGEIFCSRQNSRSQYQFAYDEAEKTLSYGGKSNWCYNYEHKHGTGRFQQVPVMLADGECDSFKLKFEQ